MEQGIFNPNKSDSVASMPHSISFKPCFVPAFPSRFRSHRAWRHGERSASALRLPVSRVSWKVCATADNASQVPIPLPNVPNVPVVPVPAAGVAFTSGAPLLVHAKRRSATHALHTLWRFSRPHTMWGTLVSVSCMHLLAWLGGGWYGTAAAAANFAVALIPALLLNVFIVGLNQYYDIPIDAINKPNLPLAAGILSLRAARRIILGTLVSGLAFCFAPGATAPLRVVLLGSVALGVAYSAPPVRLKRHPLLASACILSVRGMLVNAGFFMHAMRTAVFAALTPLVRFATCFFVAFGIVIALLKDVPDIRGDRVYGVRTLSVRLGPVAIFRGCVALLCAMFFAAAAFFWTNGSTPFASVAALVHVTVAIALAWRARSVDPSDGRQAYTYYMLTWRAFYLEYFLLPFGV